MTLLDEPTTSAAPAPEASAPEAPVDAPARLCGACGAGLAAGQDWCLTCGTAAPGRLGSRAPWRSAAAVAGLTLALVGGATAAAYAALQQDAAVTANAPAPASAAPVQPAAAAVPTPPAPPAPAPKVPKSSSTAKVPAPVDTPAAPTVSDTTPSLTSGTTSSGSTGSSTSTGSGTSTGTGTGTSTTPDDTGTGTDTTAQTPTTPVDPTLPRGPLTPITLPDTPAAVYDPLEQVKTPGDPALAIDGDLKTHWVAAAKAGRTLRIGLRIDLGSRQVVRAVRVTSDTPGFGLETFATDGSAVPETISDTRWEPTGPETTVQGGSTVIKLDKPGRYRQVVLWLTTPPETGRTVHLTELRLLG